VEIGFRTVEGSKGKLQKSEDLGLTWSSAHQAGVVRVAEEAVMITGDGNLVEIQASVRYSIDRRHVRVYLLEVEQPEDVLRAATESVLRETVAAQPFLELLTVNRERFQWEVLDRLDRRCREYGSHGLGIRLDGLSLHDLHPPAEVVDAYYDVARAMEARDRMVNEAEAVAVQEKRAAEAKALQTVRQAQSAARQKVRMAEANRDTFLARLHARNQLSAADEWKLLSEASVAVADGRDAASVYPDWQRCRRDRLATQTFLIDFRLVLETVVDGLSKRDKVIVDADKVPGRRHLLLFDPELFRPPPPVLLAPGRRGERDETRD
jgi:regulator of protease activity HflC (stomatin/prohibitin superfamily)